MVLKKIIKNFLKNNKSTLKIQQRSKSKRHNVFTEGINKIALSSNDDKENTMNRFDRNICIWNNQRFSKW